MYENLRKEIANLAEDVPDGYKTYDENGQLVIDSQMTGFEWMRWAEELFRSKGKKAEKEKLRRQLERSTGKDNAGGVLYELVAARYSGPLEV